MRGVGVWGVRVRGVRVGDRGGRYANTINGKCGFMKIIAFFTNPHVVNSS